jgi:hypothetical protein
MPAGLDGETAALLAAVEYELVRLKIRAAAAANAAPVSTPRGTSPRGLYRR